MGRRLKSCDEFRDYGIRVGCVPADRAGGCRGFCGVVSMRDKVRAVVNGQAGEWRGSVIRVEVVIFHPDDGDAEGAEVIFSAIDEIPAIDTLKYVNVLEEDMKIEEMWDNEEDIALMLRVPVSAVADEKDDEGDGD